MANRYQILIVFALIIVGFAWLYWDRRVFFEGLSDNMEVAVGRVVSKKSFKASDHYLVISYSTKANEHFLLEESVTSRNAKDAYSIGQKFLTVFNENDPEDAVALLDLPVVDENMDTCKAVKITSLESTGHFELPFVSTPYDDSFVCNAFVLYTYTYKERLYKGCRYLLNELPLEELKQSYVVLDSLNPHLHYLNIIGYRKPEEFLRNRL